MTEEVLVRCKLFAGAYSHERSYIIMAPVGVYAGYTQVHFCYDSKFNRIADEHPTEEIDGWVDGVIVGTDGDCSTIAIAGDLEGTIVIKSCEHCRPGTDSVHDQLQEQHPTPWRYFRGVIYDDNNVTVADEQKMPPAVFNLIWSTYTNILR